MYSTNQIIRRISSIVALVFVMLSPTVRAVDPPPDGGYPNDNTAEGDSALFHLTSGFGNTALGFNALYFNTYTNSNTAVGNIALFENTSGGSNTAVGDQALFSNTSAYYNTAIGYSALSSTTTGGNNTAAGYRALWHNSAGTNNVAVGYNAGFNLTTGDSNIDISNRGIAGEEKTIRIGAVNAQKATFIAGISGATVADGVAVIVDSDGHLGTITSSARFKDGIKPMDKASEAILLLKPVTFHYKHELDPAGIPQFGLVAEEVAKIDPALVACDDQGKPYTVRYEAVNAMLLNEFLKEHRKVETQEATITDVKSIVAQQQKEIEALRAALKAQTAQIQKVSDQLRAQVPVPRVVSND